MAHKLLPSLKTLARTGLLLAALHAGVAQATLVTFDDLPQPAPGAHYTDSPITDQYAAQGLLVSGGYLSGANGNQYVLGSPVLRFTFSGTLPTFVSLSTSAAFEDKVSLSAFGPGGFMQMKDTDGWAGLPENSTPYRPNQLISFESAGGISSLSLSATYFRPVDTMVDNLYFGLVPAVPEASTLAMMAAGLIMLVWRARRRKARRHRQATSLRAQAPRQ